MAKQITSINDLRIASPCPVGWDSMDGSQRVRFCSMCKLNVYNISEMTGKEVRELVTSSKGRVCVRLYRRADGTVITRDCPVGLSSIRRRVSRARGAVLAAVLSMCSTVFGQNPSKKDETCIEVSQLKLSREASKSEKGTLTGLIRDPMGTGIPGAKVLLRNESTNRKLKAITDSDGAFTSLTLPTGKYTVEVKYPGFKTFKFEHLEINPAEAVRADVLLGVEEMTATVGAAMTKPDMVESSMGTTVIRADMIQRRPIPK